MLSLEIFNSVASLITKNDLIFFQVCLKHLFSFSLLPFFNNTVDTAPAEILPVLRAIRLQWEKNLVTGTEGETKHSKKS